MASRDVHQQKAITDTMTFRIPHTYTDGLRAESKQKTESINTLLNQILKFYFEWHKPSKDAGNIYFSKAILTRVFDALTSEQIDEIADDYVKQDLNGAIMMLKRDYNIESFMDAACSWFNVSGFPYSHAETNSVDKYTMKFDMGRNWSTFYGKHLENMLMSLGVKDSEVQVTNNIVTLKISR